MLTIELPIISKRRIKKLNLLTGLASLVLLIILLYSYLLEGRIPVLDRTVAQIGLNSYLNWFYVGIIASLIIPILATIRMFLQNSKKIKGTLLINENGIYVKKSSNSLEIEYPKLDSIIFELEHPSRLAAPTTQKKGNNYIKIPSSKGLYRLEFQINSLEEREKLLQIIEKLKKDPTITIELKESS